ncbi:DUF1176 domain-containing protein [Roseomonas sp. CCTCC AB2023176]|uniref:DUF1176 domain-containing protein n=1 Tax=Roseomonas sp. CCTCC AB2023176 TaxID=3342640 RepID=UPI0035E3A140
MRFLMFGLILAPIAAFAQGPARDLPYRTFGNWLVGCDNTGACAALVLPEGEGPGRVYLRIARGGAGADLPEVSIVPVGGGAPAGGWRLSVDGGTAVGPLAPRPGDQTGRAPITARDFGTLLPGLRDGARLSIEATGRAVAAMDIRGGGAALRWMDERQGRNRTTTALVARGPGAPPASDGAVPKVPIPAPAPQDRLPRPPGVNAAGTDASCEAQGGGLPPGAAGRVTGATVGNPPPPVVRLAGGAFLYAYPCARGAQGPTSLTMVTNREGRAPRRVQFPRPGGAVATPANLSYAPESGQFGQSVRTARDCGEENRWAWDGLRFRLLSWTAMPLCRGVNEADWLVLHRAEPDPAEVPPPPDPPQRQARHGQGRPHR